MAVFDVPIWLPLLLLLPILLLMKNKIHGRRQNKNLPPSPPSLPIIGNLHQIGDLPHQSMSRLAQRYGPVMLLKFGAKPIVVISSAETAKEVLKVRDLDCCSRPLLANAGKLTYNYQDIVFAPYGEYWREIRKVCVLELFSAARVQSYRSIREEEVALLVNSISQSSSSATPVNLFEKMLPPTASILCRIAFGKSFRGSDLDNEKFQEVLHEAEAMLASFGASEFFPYVGWIVDRLSDLVDVLLRIEREQAKSGGAPFTKDNIKAILFDIFVGGSNTAAVTTVWAMAELARNPRVMKKAQDEVRNVVGNKGKVTESDTPHLPYLKTVLKETLRLHPPAAMLLPRETMVPFKISGYDICPKSLLQVNNWAIARDPKYWKNPEEFHPERFDDSSIDYKGQNFELLPFGSGRRGCPGMHMGTTTVELALANLLYCFDWKLPSGMKEEDINMDESTGPGLTQKRTPLKLVPAKLF
ncbi:hypothetical protein CIPAW_06G072100 [Carya illinoinensis]|uniref:Cytochrome P450 n=1 Tax=Carya illinoinensis TaxID=32201 RepID=A0A8T1Q8W8_CARIL|nr:hypothetical protein CIPAW_06G072100 [Carya illinoinensis]KAG6708262.1 hypothetical protein I3842_06G071900 [Carya illinoinensis]